MAAALLASGCSSGSDEAEVLPELSALLPPAESLRLALAPGVVAVAWDSNPNPSAVPVILVRPGQAGLAEYRIAAPGRTAYLQVALYRLTSRPEADEFWSERPPVVAHRTTASNLEDVSGTPDASDLRRWMLHPPPNSGRLTWHAICLAGTVRACTDVRGWVMFCRYAMEIRLQDETYTSKDQWHPLFELVAEETADAAGCS